MFLALPWAREARVLAMLGFVFGPAAAASGPRVVFAGMAGLMALAGWQSARHSVTVRMPRV